MIIIINKSFTKVGTVTQSFGIGSVVYFMFKKMFAVIF